MRFIYSFLCLTVIFLNCKNEQSTKIAAGAGNAAIDGVSKQIEQSPNDPTLYAARARLFYDMDAFNEAAEDMQKAIALDSNNVKYYHFLADAQLDNAHSKEALMVMTDAGNRFSTNMPTLLKLSEYQLILKRYDDAFATLDKILKQDPQNAEAYFMLGTTFMDIGDTSKAFGSFQKSVELDPDLADAYINLAQIAEKSNQRVAAQYYDNAVRADSNNLQAVYSKALFLQKQDKEEEAKALYRKILTKDSQFANAYFNMGIIFIGSDSIKKAEDNFNIVTQINPTNAKAYYYRGLARERQKKYEEARSDYEQTLRLEPNFTRAKASLSSIENLK
ncbi:MAG: tetratricopeptide repeat protein [Saprospiraceae bacterium]|nr:tetratricopeptide repeat protein [Saprospiraceae bacterium]MBP7679933.1 tetratricopeptide repeat protein [Saprospiraceae bacterium]